MPTTKISLGAIYCCLLMASFLSPVAQADQASAGSQVSESKVESKKREALEEIVVTGSHIRGIKPASPVVALDSEEIGRTGLSTLQEVLGALPQNFGAANPMGGF